MPRKSKILIKQKVSPLASITWVIVAMFPSIKNDNANRTNHTRTVYAAGLLDR